MTKDEFASYVSENISIDKSIVKKVLQGMTEGIQETIANGENIYIREFGTFSIKKRKAKVARNISKGEPIQMPARNVPFFKPAPAFNKKIKNSKKIK